jgi:hypothetical protein
MAAPAAGERIVFATAGDFGFVDLDKTGQWVADGRHHAAAQVGISQAVCTSPARAGVAAARRDAVEWVAWTTLDLELRSKIDSARGARPTDDLVHKRKHPLRF